MTNHYLIFSRGPIDHQSSSVINAIANGPIEMGSVVKLSTSTPSELTLPRVEETDGNSAIPYGIAVGGDTDGIYSLDGSPSGDDSTKAASAAGDTVVICTQGRCLARVSGTTNNISPGSFLTPAANDGIMVTGNSGREIIATALQESTGSADIIAVDVQRAGLSS